MAYRVETDPLFEKFIAAESVGVKDSARIQYYGESYDLLYESVVTNPEPRPKFRCMHPIHTDAENERAAELTHAFSDEHPDRAERYGYQYTIELPLPAHLEQAVRAAPRTQPELDAYFTSYVEKTWKDPTLRAHARHVYFEETDTAPYTADVPDNVLTEAGYFAAEMRVRRENVQKRSPKTDTRNTDDQWILQLLPLPADLQKAVEQAPTEAEGMNGYFRRIVEKTWKDPTVRQCANGTYYGDGEWRHLYSPCRVTREAQRCADRFAVIMRIKKRIAKLTAESPADPEEIKEKIAAVCKDRSARIIMRFLRILAGDGTALAQGRWPLDAHGFPMPRFTPEQIELIEMLKAYGRR